MKQLVVGCGECCNHNREDSGKALVVDTTTIRPHRRVGTPEARAGGYWWRGTANNSAPPVAGQIERLALLVSGYYIACCLPRPVEKRREIQSQTPFLDTKMTQNSAHFPGGGRPENDTRRI